MKMSKFDYFLSMPIVCVSRSNKSYTLLNLQIAKGVGTSCHISSKEVTTTLMGFPARTDFLLTTLLYSKEVIIPLLVNARIALGIALVERAKFIDLE